MELLHHYTNHLIRESSPYLLQHAHNPVNWYPWGEEALGKARAENKLIIVSIGYAACHWCHVMEHESFEDEEVASFMNDHFVSIKVDREERPDIDQIYMTAVQLITRHGGWPLNCIALPDGRPLYGGTYFPRGQWMEVLSAVLNFVAENPREAEQQAGYLVEGIRSSEPLFAETGKPEFATDDLDLIYKSWKRTIDFTHGGTAGAPKFPMPCGYQFLLFYHDLSKNPEPLKAVLTTLDRMAEGGIYDQVGGGFSRYSTDAYWKVPHFEKMLYDNAQLVSLYAAAYQFTKNSRYKAVVTETLEFIRRELTSPEGCFYSSLDADSERKEGKFYVWSTRELENVLGDEAALVKDYFNATAEGNWEPSANILQRSDSEREIAERHHLSEAELHDRISRVTQLLLKERSKRERPGLDDKILTSWNALMIKGYADAYRVLDEDQYLEAAVRAAEFGYRSMRREDNCLKRNYKNGQTSVNAFLDDYAFTISAFISLYQATFNEEWLRRAKDLLDYALVHFYNQSSGMFYYSSDIDPPLVARKMEVSDNVIPSSNSEMAKNLFILGHYFSDEEYILKAAKMLNAVKTNLQDGAVYYANWDLLYAWMAAGVYEVVIAGDDYEAKRKEFDQHYLPGVFFSGGKEQGSLPLLYEKFKEGQTIIYVCHNKVCRLPVNTVEEALEQMVKGH